jgi:hypothetical protein
LRELAPRLSFDSCCPGSFTSMCPYSAYATCMHKCRRCYVPISCLMEMLQLSEHISVWKMSTMITQAHISAHQYRLDYYRHVKSMSQYSSGLYFTIVP